MDREMKNHSDDISTILDFIELQWLCSHEYRLDKFV